MDKTDVHFYNLLSTMTSRIHIFLCEMYPISTPVMQINHNIILSLWKTIGHNDNIKIHGRKIRPSLVIWWKWLSTYYDTKRPIHRVKVCSYLTTQGKKKNWWNYISFSFNCSEQKSKFAKNPSTGCSFIGPPNVLSTKKLI